MSHRTGRRRPALAPSLALLIGAVVGWHSTPSAQLGTALAASIGLLVAIWAGWRPRLSSSALLLVLIFACGTLAAIEDRSLRRERACRAFPAGSAPLELHLRGRVLSGPEPTFDDERVLVVRGTPDLVPHEPSADEWVVRLIVRSSPAEPTRALDALVPGDSIRVWCRLFRPRGSGNPGAVDPATSLAARGLDALGTVKSARLIERMGPGASTAQSVVGKIRRFARQRLDVIFGDHAPARALAGAMLLGDRAALDPLTQRRLRAAGLVHLVAISGLHVGLLGCVVVVALERLRLPAALRAFLVVCFLVGFGHLVGLRPSVVRATMAVVVIVTGRLIGRRGDALNALALTAAGIVALAPAKIFDPGLQLTFLATGGILIAGLVDGTPGVAKRGVASGVAISSSAYLATAPTTAWHFGWIAPICLLSNLAALPLCAFVLASGYLAIFLIDVPVLGEGLCAAVRGATRVLLALSELAAGVDRGGYCVGRPHPALLVFYHALGLAWILARAHLGRPLQRGLAFAFALSILGVHAGPAPPEAPRTVEVAVIDVGQAQSVSARGRSGRTVLVDAGGSTSSRFDPGERIVLPFLLASTGRRIDTMVLSHDHLDHVGGAPALLRELEVGELCLPPGFHRSHPLSRLAADARERGSAIRLCEWGARFEVGELQVRVLAPRRTDLPLGSNDSSVAVVLGRAPHRLLIPGDLELEGEASMVSSPLPLRAEVLILPHHGSRSGTSRELLSRVRPRHAVVSCGTGNRFGHPHATVCRRVRDSRATLWRTDRDGMVRLETAGGEWRLRSSRR